MKWGQLSGLTVSSGAIQNLKKLLVMELFTDPDLEQFFTFVPNAKKGDKIGWRGTMSDVGWAGDQCKPTYKKPKVNFAEKTWDIGSWNIPLELCYTDIVGTIAEYCLKTGTEIGDMTGTDYMDVIIYPALKEAMIKMMWRIIWFGDKDAKLSNASGVISTTSDVELFKPCDGLFKKLFAVGTANAKQKVTIAANSEASTAEQLAKIKDAGVAIGIFDSLLENADSRIAGMEGAGIFATKSLCDALTKDLKREYKEILTWEQIFGGIKVTEYNGIKVFCLPIWDRMIMEYQNNGTKLNLPHRAVFGSPSQMLVGSPANEIISELNTWFNQDERTNKIYATGKIGTEIGQDDLFQLGY